MDGCISVLTEHFFPGLFVTCKSVAFPNLVSSQFVNRQQAGSQLLPLGQYLKPKVLVVVVLVSFGSGSYSIDPELLLLLFLSALRQSLYVALAVLEF